MLRLFVLVFALALLPARAFDFEKWVDDLANKQMERWKREKIQTLARDRDPAARLEALEGLSYTDADACIAFAGALSDKDARVRAAAANQLWKAEKRAEPHRAELTKALDDPDANVVTNAAGALQTIGMKEAELAAARKRVLSAPEATIRSRFLAARNLVGYENPRKLVGPMIEYLEQNTQSYTGSVTDSNRNNVELVEKALERLVKNTKDRSIIQPLWEALVETRNGQIPLMKALAAFEPKPEGWTRTLLRQLESPNPRVRYEALGHLRYVKQEKEVAVWAPQASRMLQDPDSSVRSNALWALGNVQGLAASEVEKVAAAASDSEASVRRSAVRALGEMAEASQAIPAATRARLASVARPVIDKAMQDEDKDVRDEAKSALRNIGSAGGTPVAAAATSSSAATPAAPATKGNEAAGMAALRARNVKFDEGSWFVALHQLDVELVAAFLDAGMSPNASVSGLGPPMRAMLFGGEACAPNVRPTKAETKAIVKLLLDRGADVKAADANGNTALSEAASKGCDRELLRTLIKAGAKINATNTAGLTPFEMGLWTGHDGLDELIAAGYRLPPDKAKLYLDGYKDRPAAIQMVKKATKK